MKVRGRSTPTSAPRTISSSSSRRRPAGSRSPSASQSAWPSTLRCVGRWRRPSSLGEPVSLTQPPLPLAAASTPVKVAMQIAGHKTESVYRRYAIVAEADIAEGTRRIAALYEAETGTPAKVIPLVVSADAAQ